MLRIVRKSTLDCYRGDKEMMSDWLQSARDDRRAAEEKNRTLIGDFLGKELLDAIGSGEAVKVGTNFDRREWSWQGRYFGVSAGVEAVMYYSHGSRLGGNARVFNMSRELRDKIVEAQAERDRIGQMVEREVERCCGRKDACCEPPQVFYTVLDREEPKPAPRKRVTKKTAKKAGRKR